MQLRQAIASATRILIVDDAVDTGTTVLSVKRSIQRINAAAEIRVAVITVTMKASRSIADYYLYSEQLVRFPWSVDA
ncbi:phosphoribosyltransferase family protein [Marinobacter sp. C2H3]|uniref:phosphoribosyltransferase family protein n=1 Tax=Marinobacter sp. C2H3 TaxID=3119003 RepID=UPI00300F4F66